MAAHISDGCDHSCSTLDLSTNSLTGSIPSNIGSLTALQYFYVYTNSLSGSIPSSITSATALMYTE